MIITGLLFQACHQQSATGTWSNAKIDTGIKNQISGQNMKLLSALSRKDVAAVKEMTSQMLITEMGSKLDTLVSKAHLAAIGDYNVLDEFYVKNASGNISTTVSSARGNSNDYEITYIPVNTDSYVSVFTSKKSIMNTMVLAIYSKYDNEWKLDALNIGLYNALDKTAPDWYTAAVKFYQKGSVVTALNKMFVMFNVARPAGTMLHYKDSADIKTFFSKLLATANSQYHFPIIVDAVKTKPQIFAVDPNFTVNATYKGVFPVIKYKSTISIRDTVALKAENMALQKVIGSVFKGIDTDESAILYRAYNQLPDRKNEAPFRGFVQKLK